ncbi:MAG: phosphatase PAP2 family protein [Patescibacteria group bacterium]|nr:phosphatase PAP2 family protein [Patescibacteria group bacterium]
MMKLSKLIKKLSLSKLIFLEIILGFIGILLTFGLFAALTEDVLRKETLFYDQLITEAIYSLRTPLLTKIMILVTTTGGNTFFIGISLTVILFLLNKHKTEAVIFAWTIVIGVAMNFFLKLLFHRPRPILAPLLSTNDFSYPSGHAMNSLIIYGFLVFLFFRFTRNKKLTTFVGILAAIWVLVIGFSRIYLGVHFPTDILGGYLAGAWILFTALVIEKTLFLRRY